MIRVFFFLFFILCYSLLFTFQEQKSEAKNVVLDIAMPVNFYKIFAGYAKQLAAELLFIRTSVFLGGVRPGTSPLSYSEPLANNFEVMTRLYPHFIDPYYFCQGFLPHISLESAQRASKIFETGIAAYPNDIFLRFFYGANFFLSMNEPLKGATVFKEASKLPEAPPMFAHLAVILSAQGGDIAAGLISLKSMLHSEKDEMVLARYQEEIVIFEQALEVQKALLKYTDKFGAAPHSLEQLVPEFIVSIPDIKDSFVLVYNKPTLHLQRPDKRKKIERVVD